ncbi:cell wall biosynthesis protein glycosyltransferase family [methanogenic archaeon ISO4-H5]|nr:cell wall biosynthesis protein glycosyltransferase family [methanogenic archaeon ISO4-H5]
MKTISVLIPTYNEEDNVEAIAQAVIEQLEKLDQYNYTLTFIDNDSQDSTREKIRGLCSANPKIRAIFNAKNYGQFNSPYYGITQMDGDCCICMVADFQEPPEMIPELVEWWEKGYKLVLGQKQSSDESKIVYRARGMYYKFMKKRASAKFMEQVTGFGLYDRSFIDIMKSLDDPRPFLRGVIAEMGYNIKIIPFNQPKRRAGKSSNNFAKLYDGAMQSITGYTKYAIRFATFLGLGLTIVASVCLAICLGYKCVHWDTFPIWNYFLTLIVFLAVSVELFFLGLVGEYVLDIRDQVRKRPLVIEAERINFDKP